MKNLVLLLVAICLSGCAVKHTHSVFESGIGRYQNGYDMGGGPEQFRDCIEAIKNITPYETFDHRPEEAGCIDTIAGPCDFSKIESVEKFRSNKYAVESHAAFRKYSNSSDSETYVWIADYPPHKFEGVPDLKGKMAPRYFLAHVTVNSLACGTFRVFPQDKKAP